jgi:hypothetical protein
VVQWVALQAALVLVAVMATGTSTVRRLTAIAVLTVAFVVPWLAPPQPIPRILLSFLSLLGFMKAVQVAFGEGPWTVGRRIWHALAPYDVRGVRFRTPSLGIPILSNLAVNVLVSAVALFALTRAPALSLGLRWPLRMLAGSALAYGCIEVTTDAIRFLHLCVGLDVPAVQRAPILSLSLREFWGRRWNLPVSAWLKQFVFRPLARRGYGGWGLLAAFLVSGLFHGWMVAPGIGTKDAGTLCLFFIVQGPLVLLEAPLGVRGWPPFAARAWTFGWLLGTSPLFLGPLLPVIGF